MESETGWWLITHPDHAHLAGEFATAWGNAQFRRPEPRARVLKGIACHDDGWAARDAHPSITRQGKPSAFSTDLVGKYSAFEEIDLAKSISRCGIGPYGSLQTRILRWTSRFNAHLQSAYSTRGPFDD